MSQSTASTKANGQALVIFAVAIAALLAVTGLILDGGAVLAQQRVAQNGSDAAALAGGVTVWEQRSGVATRTNADVYQAIAAMANANGLENWSAEYARHDGSPSGIAIANSAGPIPSAAWGVRVYGDRTAETSFSRIVGVNSLAAGAAATALVGPLSYDCPLAETPCALLPLTFPVQVFQCDSEGNLEGGTWIGAPPPDGQSGGYWPTRTLAEMTPENLAILPFCRGSGLSTGTFGWLDLDPSIPTLAGEITGPLTVDVPIPDWYKTQTGNPNSVDGALSAYIGMPVLIPLHNQACRRQPDPGPNGQPGVCTDPGVAGDNTWYYVHTAAVFVLHSVHVQGNQVQACATPPGEPTVPVTNGTGFLGCIKGWFVDYVLSTSINPDPEATENATYGLQLIR